jgi:hypothetical protein
MTTKRITTLDPQSGKVIRTVDEDGIITLSPSLLKVMDNPRILREINPQKQKQALVRAINAMGQYPAAILIWANEYEGSLIVDHELLGDDNVLAYLIENARQLPDWLGIIDDDLDIDILDQEDPPQDLDLLDAQASIDKAEHCLAEAREALSMAKNGQHIVKQLQPPPPMPPMPCIPAE